MTVCLGAASVCQAQTGSGSVMGEFHTIDVREFAASFKWESPQGSAILTRGTAAPDDIRWIDRIRNLPDYMHTFYDNYGVKVHQVLDGGSNYLSDPEGDITDTKNYGGNIFTTLRKVDRTIDFTYPADMSPTQANLDPIVNAAILDDSDPLNDDIYTFMPYLFLCMNYDYPEAFWIGNGYVWTTSYDYYYQVKAAGKGTINYTYYVLYLIKGNDFDCRIEPFTTAQAVQEGVAEYKDAIDAILDGMPNTTRYGQIRYLNEWLTKHNAYCSDYNPSTAPKIVWSPISALRGTNGTEAPVCEGYSRAFKILCDKLDIPCIIAIGNAKGSVDGPGESHMWNEVKMNDGQWYAVDVTWNDPIVGGLGDVQPKVSGYENEKWLLLGRNDIVDTDLTFAQSHPNSVGFDQEETALWDFDEGTLIADSRFDVFINGVASAPAIESATVYSLLGVNLGTFPSMDAAMSTLEPGIYIINGRKVAK